MEIYQSDEPLQGSPYLTYDNLLFVPPKVTISILVSIAKEIVVQYENAYWMMKLYLFLYQSVKTPVRFGWPSSHKELGIFVKHVMGPILPSLGCSWHPHK